MSTIRYRCRTRRVHPPAHGFTLIEMTIVIVVLGVLAAATTPMFVNSMRAYDINQTNLVTLSKLRYATERIAREIREVRYTGANYAIGPMTSTALSFTKNDAANTVVTITAAPPGVTLGYSAPAMSATLTDQVTTLQFAYYQADGVTTTASNVNVAYVQVTLTLQDPNSGAYQQQTRIALRNKS